MHPSREATYSLFLSQEWQALAHACGARLRTLAGSAGLASQPWASLRSEAYRKGLAPLVERLQADDREDLPVLGPWNSTRFVAASPEAELARLPAALAVDRGAAIPFLPALLQHRIEPPLVIHTASADAYHLLPVEWRSYEDYTASLPAKIRSALRAENRRLRAAGSEHGMINGRAAVAAIERFAATHDPDQIDLALRAAEVFGDDMLVFHVTDRSGHRAICTAIEYEDELYVRRYLQRADAVRDGFTYFTTVFRAAIEHACEQRLIAVHAGLGAADVKTKRGFSSLPQVHCLAIRGS